MKMVAEVVVKDLHQLNHPHHHLVERRVINPMQVVMRIGIGQIKTSNGMMMTF